MKALPQESDAISALRLSSFVAAQRRMNLARPLKAGLATEKRNGVASEMREHHMSQASLTRRVSARLILPGLKRPG